MADVRRFATYLILRQHLGWTVAEIDSMSDEMLAAVLYVIGREM